MHRFLIDRPPAPGQIVALNPKEAHHALKVLRVKTGEAVELLDGKGGRYGGFVATAGKDAVEISVRGPLKGASGGVEITLAPAVIKPERMEWMLEKSCELGASAWMPVLSERSVVKLSRERWQAKGTRWKRIAQESCKQCGQPRLPVIGEPLLWKELLQRIPLYDLVLIPTLSGPVQPLHRALSAHRTAKKALILIGPEGDFSENEVKSALAAGAVPVTLGERVLRAETAAIYALSVAQFYWGEAAEKDED